MWKMNHFSLFCKSYLVLFLTLLMAPRFYAAPPTDLVTFYVKQGFFGTVLGIFGVAFMRALSTRPLPHAIRKAI